MLDFSSLSKAIDSLEESLCVTTRYQDTQGTSTPEFRTFRAGVIQNFEYTYELAWKAMRTWLAENLGKSVVDGITRKELFRHAAQNKLIDDPTLWFQFHYNRNQTSHTYDEKTAEQVFNCSQQFYIEATQLLKTLNDRND